MIDITSKNLNIRLTAAENITAYLCGGNLQVIFGKNAEMNMSSAVTYIQSGKAEITEAVADCIEAYNINANSKTADFNDNAELKVADFDDNAAKAIAEAQNWAHQAETSASSMAKRDLSNLTLLGEAKFSAKQDVISDLATIRNGAALGATALQPGALNGYATQAWIGQQGYITSGALEPYALSADLATVATSGSYSDLSDKPDLSTKADIDLSNCTKPHIVETYKNGSSWYRIWSDGWCEQGGFMETGAGRTTVYLLKPYRDTAYSVQITSSADNNSAGHTQHVIHRHGWNNTSYFQTSLCEYYGTTTFIGYWETRGYIS